MIKKQFTLYLENKPGELASVTRRLAAARINIQGISVSASTDVALVQLVPSDAARTRRLLVQCRIPYSTQEVSIIELKDQPGSLSSVVSKLSETKVNINYVYATGCSCGSQTGGSFVVISADDLKSVEKAWKNIRKQK